MFYKTILLCSYKWSPKPLWMALHYTLSILFSPNIHGWPVTGPVIRWLLNLIQHEHLYFTKADAIPTDIFKEYHWFLLPPSRGRILSLAYQDPFQIENLGLEDDTYPGSTHTRLFKPLMEGIWKCSQWTLYR